MIIEEETKQEAPSQVEAQEEASQPVAAALDKKEEDSVAAGEAERNANQIKVDKR